MQRKKWENLLKKIKILSLKKGISQSQDRHYLETIRKCHCSGEVWLIVIKYFLIVTVHNITVWLLRKFGKEKKLKLCLLCPSNAIVLYWGKPFGFYYKHSIQNFSSFCFPAFSQQPNRWYHCNINALQTSVIFCLFNVRITWIYCSSSKIFPILFIISVAFSLSSSKLLRMLPVVLHGEVIHTNLLTYSLELFPVLEVNVTHHIPQDMKSPAFILDL